MRFACNNYWIVSTFKLCTGPPAPRCRDSDQGGYVGEWMVLHCYGIDGSEKGLLITKKARKLLGVCEVFEKTRSFSKLPHSYFLYVGVPRWVTKLFRIEEENIRCAEIQIGGNSFRRIRYVFRKIIICVTETVHFWEKTVNLDEKRRFPGKGIVFAKKRRAHTRKVDIL